MIWLISALLLWLACGAVYRVSSKHIAQTRQSRYRWLSKYPRLVRIVAGLLLLLVILLLRHQLSQSIGFVAVWVLITPIAWIFILSHNDLKPKKRSGS